MAFAHRVVGAHFNRLRVAVVGHLFERHVLRNVHHHRAGAATAGNVEGFFHGLGQIARVLDQKVVLDDGAGDAHGVTFLERIHANGVGRHLAAHDHHRDTVHVSGGNAGDGVGDARAGGDQCHAHIARGAGITVSRVNRRLLVAHQHMLNGVLLEKCVVDVQHGTAGVTPDVLDAFGLQGFDENFCAPQLMLGTAAAGLVLAEEADLKSLIPKQLRLL